MQTADTPFIVCELCFDTIMFLSRRKRDIPLDVSEEQVNSIKRLRGGGDEFEDELFDEDAFQNDLEEPDEDMLENDDYDISLADNADTAINFADLSESQMNRWARPAVSEDALDASKSDLHLQWLDIDMFNGQSLSRNPNSSKENVVGAEKGEVPIIRVYGVNEQGNSVVAFIHGYTPYGYFALPEGHELSFQDESEKNQKLGSIRDILNQSLKSAKSSRSKAADEMDDLCLGVQYIDDHKSIMGYNTSHTKFLKVYVAMPTLVPTLKRLLEEGMHLPGISPISSSVTHNMWQEGEGSSYQPFECNVPFVLRFMIDEDICGAGWLTLPRGAYKFRSNKVTNCQVGFLI